MLDLSPEKLIMLLGLGLVVLGPNKLPTAARAAATGLVRARRLASSLTDPLTASLEEPRRVFDTTIADLRGAIEAIPVATGSPRDAEATCPPDPSLN